MCHSPFSTNRHTLFVEAKTIKWECSVPRLWHETSNAGNVATQSHGVCETSSMSSDKMCCFSVLSCNVAKHHTTRLRHVTLERVVFTKPQQTCCTFVCKDPTNCRLARCPQTFCSEHSWRVDSRDDRNRRASCSPARAGKAQRNQSFRQLTQKFFSCLCTDSGITVESDGDCLVWLVAVLSTCFTPINPNVHFLLPAK